MKKSYLLKQICSLLFLVYFIPCYGQTDEYFFRFGLRDKAGNLWFSNMGNGVYRYNASSDKFTHFTKEDGLNDNNVESIFEDKAGNIWFSTDYGVCSYDGKSFTDISAKAGLFKFEINCILEDRIGNIWIGSNGWGVSRYNPMSGAVTNFTKEQGLGGNVVQCMLEDKAGNLWCGERDGGVSRYDAASGKFTIVNGEGCFSTQMMGIVEDKIGNIWFANLYEGLCRYDGKTYTHFTEEDGVCRNNVDFLYQDKKGNLWFGSDTKLNTGEGGLCRYDGKSFTHFSTEDGLTNSDVFSAVEDMEGNIWVCTRGGLFRYHSPSGKFIDYTGKL